VHTELDGCLESILGRDDDDNNNNNASETRRPLLPFLLFEERNMSHPPAQIQKVHTRTFIWKIIVNIEFRVSDWVGCAEGPEMILSINTGLVGPLYHGSAFPSCSVGKLDAGSNRGRNNALLTPEVFVCLVVAISRS